MKTLGKLILIIVILVGLIVGAATFFLPGFVSRGVESQIQDKLHPEMMQLRVESSPGTKLLLGQVDYFRGDLENVKLGKINFKNFKFDLNAMEISPIKMLLNREIVITSMGRGEIEGVVTQQDLQTFMEENIKGLEITNVDVTSKGIDVQGTINIGGFLSGKAEVQGVLELKNNTLLFTPQKFLINNSGIGGLNASVLKGVAIYDFADFPIPVKADRIETSNGEIHIFVKPEAK